MDDKAIAPIRVKNVVIGEGAPKIIVPLTGRTSDDLRAQVDNLTGSPADIVEWRVDFCDALDDVAAVTAQARSLARQLDGIPLLATCRTAHEGGEAAIDDRAYTDLNLALAGCGAVDLLDVEYRRDPETVRSIIAAAHRDGVAVVASNHDFDATPDRDDIVSRLRAMQELGADICKIAVMPRSAADVLTLLDATRVMHEQYATRPLITMAMGGLGVISRLCGQVFGSAATFGTVGAPSAPGQVDAEALRAVLELLDRSA